MLPILFLVLAPLLAGAGALLIVLGATVEDSTRAVRWGVLFQAAAVVVLAVAIWLVMTWTP